LTPANKLGQFIIPLFPARKESIDRSYRYIPPFQGDGEILDVGFGGGEFMEKIRDIGWRVSGVDPDDKVVALAKKRGFDNVRQGSIDAFADNGNRFAVVTMRHVFEHLHAPKENLRTIFEILKPGGVLFIEMPNIDSYSSKKFKRNWLDLDPPRHLAVYTWEATIKLLNDAGFHKLELLPARFAYYSRAQSSRAIVQGSDPQTHKVRLFRDRLIGGMVSIRTLFRTKESEFITLMAYKPK
jgi:SAM-dependent methyltransferase